MNPTPDLTDAEIGELDNLLAAIPEPLEALDVSMLDGYLCGVLAQPIALAPAQWLDAAFDWNFDEGVAPLQPETAGWHYAKHERLLALVQRRFEALHRMMVEDGWFDPVVLQPEDDDGNPLTGKAAIEAALGPWVMGFEHAMNQFPALIELPSAEVPDLMACLWRHLPAQSEDELAFTQALDQEHPLNSLDSAIEDLIGNVIELAEIGRTEKLRVTTVRRNMPKVGRNDACPCGSGRKFKLCHGREGGSAA
ncbi:MAG: UPF0149 family protein [Leptothrix sp. (in: b-proteobacteria)]